jgi:hypothetical protein
MSAWEPTETASNVVLLRPVHPRRARARHTMTYLVVRTLFRGLTYTLIAVAIAALTSEWSFIR